MFAAVLIAALLATSPVNGAAVDDAWRAKVSRSALANAEIVDHSFFVFMREQASLSAGRSAATKSEKGRLVCEALRDVADRTQAGVIAELEAARVEHRTFWITNMILVRGDQRVLESMARRDDVAYIFDNSPIGAPRVPAPIADTVAKAQLRAIEWNLQRVRADRVWNEGGVTGTGVVVATIDSGVDWDHPALIDQYRGWDGSSADHEYNWYDAVHTGACGCAPGSPEPCDDWGHGTGVMGVLVGDDGAGNQIGMAPTATWITVRGYCLGSVIIGDVSTIAESLQWILAPTDLTGSNPDPSKAPDVLSDSWRCSPSFGCTDPLVFLPMMQSLRSAGIVLVNSAGNDGPDCQTISHPPAIYDEVITVGGTIQSGDQIWGLSSRGPGFVNSIEILKPDVVAPAGDIRTAVPGGGYAIWSGTSFSAPHVAGEAALLISADPTIAGNVEIIEQLIFGYTAQKTTTQDCGSIPGSQVPNNTSGWGRINAWQAFSALLSAVGAPAVAGESSFELLSAAPNPAAGGTTISYRLSRDTSVHLAIYNSAGRKVRVLENGHQSKGAYAVDWDGRDERGREVASGAYFYRLTAGGQEKALKLIFLK